MQRIIIDRELCVMAGQCVIAAPEVFDQDDDGIAILLDENPPDSEQGNVNAAIDACPARAIWYDE